MRCKENKQSKSEISSLNLFQDHSLHTNRWTVGQNDGDQEHTLWGRRRFFLPVTYFPRIHYTLLLYQ